LIAVLQGAGFYPRGWSRHKKNAAFAPFQSAKFACGAFADNTCASGGKSATLAAWTAGSM
jgi:hypothetical protein